MYFTYVELVRVSKKNRVDGSFPGHSIPSARRWERRLSAPGNGVLEAFSFLSFNFFLRFIVRSESVIATIALSEARGDDAVTKRGNEIERTSSEWCVSGARRSFASQSTTSFRHYHRSIGEQCETTRTKISLLAFFLGLVRKSWFSRSSAKMFIFSH